MITFFLLIFDAVLVLCFLISILINYHYGIASFELSYILQLSSENQSSVVLISDILLLHIWCYNCGSSKDYYILGFIIIVLISFEPVQ